MHPVDPYCVDTRFGTIINSRSVIHVLNISTTNKISNTNKMRKNFSQFLTSSVILMRATQLIFKLSLQSMEETTTLLH